VILQLQSLATEPPLPVWNSELLVLHQASGWRIGRWVWQLLQDVFWHFLRWPSFGPENSGNLWLHELKATSSTYFIQ